MQTVNEADDNAALRQADEHHRAGRLSDAEMCYRQVLSRRPDHPWALYGLATLAAQVNRPDVAAELYQRAIAVKPDLAEAHNDLANLYLQHDRLDEAIASYRRAVAVDPRYPEAHSNLCNALRIKGLHNEAIEHGRTSLAIDPNSADAASNLGNALQSAGRLDEAISFHERAATVRPQAAEIWANLGAALGERCDYQRAIDCYRRALSLRPDLAVAHWNLGCALLQLGDFANGWREVEWRWRWPGFRAPRRNFSQPQWKGEPLDGKRILLHAEQGFGDAIQFVRYAPMVAKRGGRVILECHAELLRLFSNGIEGVEQIVPFSATPPAFDVHCPLLSIPLAVGTTLATIPAEVPYLKCDPELAARWKEKIGDEQKMKVGVVWAGRPTHDNDRNRSMPAAALPPLQELKEVRFYSLQKGAPNAPPFMTDLTADIRDFADTAALIVNLDLVISVDTSVAHLAGALGRNVWTLLPVRPEWRWLLDREDSPWYPTMKLFRQTRRGEWTDVIGRVVATLQNSPAHGPG
jgi:tetratricopeptide (TPR) repeat protein